MKIIYPVVVMCIGLFLMSCSKSPQSKIIGKWEGEDGTMEFLDNGEVVVQERIPKGLSFPLTFNYKFIGKNYVKTFLTQGEQVTGISEFEVSFPTKNKLIIYDSERSSELNRVYPYQ